MPRDKLRIFLRQNLRPPLHLSHLPPILNARHGSPRGVPEPARRGELPGGADVAGEAGEHALVQVGQRGVLLGQRAETG